MILKPWFAACIAIFAAAPALAQLPSAKPLNLNLPLQYTPATASSTHGTAKSAPASKSRQHAAQPDAARDPDGRPPYVHDPNAPPPHVHVYAPACNNQAYKRPRVFGSVGLGVFSGSHIEGNYQTGTVSIAKALGSCYHPTGGIIFTIGFGRETINGPFWPR